MGVVSSMATAISGLESNGTALSVISDNIVNANTTGFKAARSEFQNILSQDLGVGGAGGQQVGRGTAVAGITTVLTQGPITRTDRGTDLAISGNGFFVLKSDSQGQTYTRDGSFRFDKDGWMTNLNGARVQAYQSTPDGKITGKTGDVRIPYNTIPAKSTNQIQLHVNMDARQPVTAPLDLERPEQTSQFTTGLQVFDSVGNAQPLTVYFNKVADGAWEWHAMTDGANVTGGIPGEPTDVVTGTLLFDPYGRLQNSQQTIVNSSFTNGAIPDQNLQFDFGDPIDAGGSGEKGTTQYGSKSAMFRNVQDGWSAGVLADVGIDADGMITGVYTNGQNRVLGQLAVSRFEATERLSKVGENQFRESVDSGQPLIGKPNTNGRGIVMTKSLESSNVDIAHEFVEMIKAQRGFQASAKSVTTANEMLDEIINIKQR